MRTRLLPLSALLLALVACRGSKDQPSVASQYEAAQALDSEPPPDPPYPHEELEAHEPEAHVARAAAVTGPAWTPTWQRPELRPALTNASSFPLPPQGAHGTKIARVKLTYTGYWSPFISFNQPHSRMSVEDLWVLCVNGNTTLLQSKWDGRLYLWDGQFLRCIFEGAYWEHGLYSSTRGNLTLREVWFEDCGAQGLQLRHTGNRADPQWNSPRGIRLVDVHSVECGLERGAGRAGFSISIKDQGPLSDVWFERVAVRTVNQTAVKVYNGQTYDSFGGVCIEYCRTFTWIDGFVHMKKPDRPSIQLFDYSRQSPTKTGPDVIDIERLHLDGGALAVRVGDGSLIDISNCTGSGWINCYYWDPATSRWRLDPSMTRSIGQGFYYVRT